MPRGSRSKSARPKKRKTTAKTDALNVEGGALTLKPASKKRRIVIEAEDVEEIREVEGEQGSAPLASASSDESESEGRRKSRLQAIVASAGGFDRGPEILPQPQGVEPPFVATSRRPPPDEKKLVAKRSVRMPPSIDTAFMRRLFGQGSTFPGRFYEETGCVVAIEREDDFMREVPSVLLKGDTDASVEAASMRLRVSIVQERIDEKEKAMRPGGGTVALLNGSTSGSNMISINRMAPANQNEKLVSLPDSQVPFVMTVECKEAISEATGADIDWEPPKARLHGTAVQIGKAEKLLLRVAKHCLWGASSAKVSALLKPKKVSSVRVRLTPLGAVGGALKAFEVHLAPPKLTIKMGKGKENNVVVPDAMVSRQHCIVQLDQKRGGVFIHDVSTNGTWFNGRKLPGKNGGKVIVMHGDEVLFKNPRQGDPEFGYIINLQHI